MHRLSARQEVDDIARMEYWTLLSTTSAIYTTIVYTHKQDNLAGIVSSSPAPVHDSRLMGARHLLKFIKSHKTFIERCRWE